MWHPNKFGYSFGKYVASEYIRIFIRYIMWHANIFGYSFGSILWYSLITGILSVKALSALVTYIRGDNLMQYKLPWKGFKCQSYYTLMKGLTKVIFFFFLFFIYIFRFCSHPGLGDVLKKDGIWNVCYWYFLFSIW